MTVFETLSLMIGFSTLITTIIISMFSFIIKK